MGRLIRTNPVAATAGEINAAVAVASAFLTGAGSRSRRRGGLSMGAWRQRG